MMVTTRKYTPKLNIAECCSACNGYGALITQDVNQSLQAFDSMCRECLGTGALTKDVRARRAAAQSLKYQLSAADCTVREAAKRFGGEMRDWIRATQGEVSLDTIFAYWRKALDGMQTSGAPEKHATGCGCATCHAAYNLAVSGELPF